MQTITPPKIPDNYVGFAKACAAAAEANGIDSFQMTFKPTFEQRISSAHDPRVSGDMRVLFTAVDGRGRPSKNLSIDLVANLTLPIVSSPATFC